MLHNFYYRTLIYYLPPVRLSLIPLVIVIYAYLPPQHHTSIGTSRDVKTWGGGSIFKGFSPKC